MDNKIAETPCILIGGTGRSGSNILKKILSQNNKIYSLPFESRFTVDPDGIFPSYRNLTQTVSPFEADKILNRLSKLLNQLSLQTSSDKIAIKLEKIALSTIFQSKNLNLKTYKEWELEKHFSNFSEQKRILFESIITCQFTGIWPAKKGSEESVKNVFSTLNNKELTEHFSKFLNNIYRNILIKNNKQIYLDDNTFNIVYAKEIYKLLPNAHMIHIVRDPRDVVSSFMNQRWAPSDFFSAVEFYKATMNQCIESTKKIPHSNITTIRLEDLCEEPNDTISILCEKLGIQVTEKMLSVKLNKSNSGRWKKDIPENLHKKINSDVSFYIKQFGYVT